MAAFALLLVPVAAVAGGGFTDVDDDSVFKADIQWLADAGVTKGCNPPANTEFCPGDNVTREQMSAFMHRLAINKVVDAKTAIAADHAAEADVAATAGNAANADKLDGKDSAAFATSTHNHDGAYPAIGHDHDADYLAKTGKAADADKLDGIDSGGFVQHGEIVIRQSTTELTPHFFGAPTTMQYATGGTIVSGDGRIVFGLTGPAVLGGVDYGLKSAEYCIESVAGGAYVTYIEIVAESPVGIVVPDFTDRTVDGCYTVIANNYPAHAYDMYFKFAGGGTLRLSGLQSTWAPVDSLPPAAPLASSGDPDSTGAGS